MRILPFSEFIKESNNYSHVDEATQSSKGREITHVYKGANKELDRIIMKLSGNQSAEITKLCNEFVETKEALDKISILHADINKRFRGAIDKMFEEEEKFITRVIETAKWTFTFAKYSRSKTTETKKINYEKALDEFYEIYPDIKDTLKEIIEKNTEIINTISSEKAGYISSSHIKLNEGVVRDFFVSIAEKIEDIYSALTSKLKLTNNKLEKQLVKYRSLGARAKNK